MRHAYLTLFISLLFSIMLQAQDYSVKRVEPLNWWTGMHSPELQIMIYGKNIGELEPQIKYPGVTIERTEHVENNNYLFLYLNVAHKTEPGTFDIQFIQNGSSKIAYSYSLKQRQKGSANRKGFNSSDAIYLVTPDRFANGNPENDMVAGYKDTLNRMDDYGRHGGDIQGIINHLNYINDMGFTALWINPLLENAMPESSYHGYAITDYYHIDPRFGSNKLYKELSKKAEDLGIKLIMDMVTNHIGSHHWWMQDPPTPDWIHYEDKYRQTNNIHDVIQDPHASEIDKKEFTNGWFVKSMPDLNQSNPLLADYLIYNSIWWIEYANLQGIRHDTHPYAGQKFMEKWTCRILQEYPNFNIVGEEWNTHPAVLAKWQRGSSLPVDFSSCLPSLMDFPVQSALVKALTQKEEWGSGFINLYKKLTFDYLYPDPNNLVIFPDNHDMDRFYRQVDNNYDLFKMGITYILTSRGIPQIYYGTEILVSNKKIGNDGNIRSDFPGGWQSDTVNAFTGTGLSKKKKEAQTFIKKLLNWRRKNPALFEGKLMQYVPRQDGFYVYFRYSDDKSVMVILNKNDSETHLGVKRFYERLNGFSRGTDVASGKNYILDDLNVPAHSALILELK